MQKISGYRTLTYLESTGTQYINTGLSLSSYRFVTDIYFTQWDTTYSSADNYFVGGMSNSNRNYFVIWSGKWDIGGTSDITSSISPSLNTWYSIDCSNVTNNQYIKVDGETLVTSTQSHSTNPIYLFAGYSLSAKCYARMKETKFYDSSNNLIRDYIPVERESDNVLGLYDLVNNVFYTNAGSGTFIKGDYYLETHINPEGKGTITDEIIEGYEILDYIQSSGTQYIDTGFKPNQDTRVKTSYILVGNTANIPYGVDNGSATQSTFGFYNSGTRCGYCYDGQADAPYSVVSDVLIESDQNKNVSTLKMNGTIYSETKSYRTFSTSYNLCIFATNRSGTILYGGATRMYSLKLYDNDTLIRDYVPARRISDNSIGMYDKVNSQFYANRGSGTFIGGQQNRHKLLASKKATTKFNNWLVNGYTRLEYIESTGTQYIDLGNTMLSTKTVIEDDMSIDYTYYRWSINGLGGVQGSFYWGVNNNTFYYSMFGVDQSTGISTYVNNTRLKYKLDCINRKYIVTDIDGNEIVNVSTVYGTPSQNKMYLFAYDATNKHKEKKYGFKVYDDNELILDFIPVIRHIDGQIGLLDLVHFKFYGNSGTGEFIGGSVV